MQVVEYDAIVKNAQYFKNIIGQSRLCAVVKNDAYGHGLVRTVCALRDVVHCFAVGSLDEAMQIAPFGCEILILLPLSSAETELAVQYGFILTVDSFETLCTVAAFSSQKPRVHIKVESGMNRLGFALSDLPAVAEMLSHTVLSVEGVFSHFFEERESRCDGQLRLFNKARAYLEARLQKHLIAHIANTSATLLSDKYHLDMVRVGLGLYGYGNQNLIPAKTVFAKVLAVHDAKAGQTVGYGATFTVPHDTRIAVLDIGYAKGLSRALSGGKVQIGENIFPIVGKICMAMCMVDIQNADVHVGDSVVVQGEGINNATEQVIVYELLCNLK